MNAPSKSYAKSVAEFPDIINQDVLNALQKMPLFDFRDKKQENTGTELGPYEILEDNSIYAG